MAVFKCKMCGGTLEISGGQSVIICDYCGTQQTLPRLNDERIADLYDRANHFRRNNDYDKALGIYELILNENKEDAEAYWSIVLCRYGIEYVEDPKLRKRIPTINRAQFTSILADDDYKSALKYADAFQRAVYEREAKSIDEIHKNILKIAQKEEPYDVFICYKDKDSAGKPTKDRVIATEIYNRLTREKFKVFFAYVTLDEKLGHEYEPYIFAALQSAKVMIVLGTQPDYFNAVWVKNEWSRYLALIKGGAKKTLISAYKNMDAYDLPDELSLQAQDMDKMGFLENLVFNVRREIERNTEKKDNTDSSAIIIKGTNENANNFIKRAFMALEDRNWRDATIYFEKVLNLDPECALAYAGKLLSELQVCNFDMLGGYPTVFEDRANYKRALQFADENLKNILITSISQVKYRIACNLMEQKKYEDALAIFEVIQYRDSLSKASECRRIIEAIEQEKKAKLLIEERERKQKSLAHEARQLQEKISLGRFAFAYIVVILLIVLAAVVVISNFGIDNVSILLEIVAGLFLIFAAIVLKKIEDISFWEAFGWSLFLNLLTWIYVLAISCKTVFETPQYKAQYSRIKQELAQCRNQMKNENRGLYANVNESTNTTFIVKGKNTFGYKNGSAYRFVIDNQQRLTIIAERDDNQESIYLSPGSHTLRLFIDNPDGSPMVTNFQTQIVIYESGKNIFRCNRSGMLTDLAVVPEK